MAAKKQRFRALVALSDKDRKPIAQPGEVTDKIPAKSVPWLIEQGLIEKVEE